MDNRPIGIFDSGVGGLSAVRALVQAAPREAIVYLGDTAHVPYGDRPVEELRRLACQNARFLRTHDIKALVLACNTTSSNSIPALQKANPDIPVIGVIEPAAREAAQVTAGGRIGVIATNAVVRSGAYERAIRSFLPDASVISQGCPALVPLVEAGHVEPGDPMLMPTLREYLAPLLRDRVDTLVLGCTHYPFLRAAATAVTGPDVAMVDSGSACVGTLLEALEQINGLAAPDAAGSQSYFCSANRAAFVQTAGLFLGHSIDVCTWEVNIDQY